MALELSLLGVTASMTLGVAAERLPTPKQRTRIATGSSARFERANAKRTMGILNVGMTGYDCISMGLFFDTRPPHPDITSLVTEALKATPPEPGTTEERATALAGQLHPLVRALSSALDAQPPKSDAEATTAAVAATNELLGGQSFNTGRFIVAFSIFASLLGGGIATEATHLTTASGTLYGFAGAIFGIVTAFLGSEKG